MVKLFGQSPGTIEADPNPEDQYVPGVSHSILGQLCLTYSGSSSYLLWVMERVESSL
jgi:hypothetical protein